MDRNLELYLDTFDKHLKSVPTSERIDIIKEIKSAMIEMEQKEGLTPQQITENWETPKIWHKHIWEKAFPKLPASTGRNGRPSLPFMEQQGSPACLSFQCWAYYHRC